MFMEVYYEHYAKNCNGHYWGAEEKQIPYMVLIKDRDKREAFHDFLKNEGFSCVSWNRDYPGVLVNMRLRRFALITKACKHSCVNDRNYTEEEFLSEVYAHWKLKP